MVLAMPSLPPEVVHQIVEILPDNPNYGECRQGQYAALDDQCFQIGHRSTLNPEPVFNEQFEAGDFILVQLTAVGDHVPDLVKL